MYRLKLLFFIVVLSLFSQAVAQTATTELTKKVYQTYPISKDQSPEIDGRLEDSIWRGETHWESGFVQRLPDENAAPSEQTSFKLVYDASYLYVGIQCHNHNASEINQRMSRRDGYNGDWVEVIFDSYHDLRSAFSFSVSAAGVKSDKSVSLNGTEEDLAWN
ncbi:MAG: sugar-binding protein, partial [Bacteroidota bacterium]